MNPFAENDMTTAHFFFLPRFLTRFALSRAIFLSTACGATFTSFLANWSKALQPFGFLLIVAYLRVGAIAGATEAVGTSTNPRVAAAVVREKVQLIQRENLPAEIARCGAFHRSLDKGAVADGGQVSLRPYFCFIPDRLPPPVSLNLGGNAALVSVATSNDSSWANFAAVNTASRDVAPGWSSHLLNPHKARVVDAGKFAVGEALADGALQGSLKSASVIALAGVESERR